MLFYSVSAVITGSIKFFYQFFNSNIPVFRVEKTKYCDIFYSYHEEE